MKRLIVFVIILFAGCATIDKCLHPPQPFGATVTNPKTGAWPYLLQK